MASANVELVRSIRAGWDQGDFASVAWADPEIEFVIVDGPAPGSWTGLAGMAEGLRDFLGAWDRLRSEGVEYRELDGERVLVLTRISGGRGKTSGIDVSQLRMQGAGLFHIRDGKVMRYVVWFDRDRALADLGLHLEADSRDSGPSGMAR